MEWINVKEYLPIESKTVLVFIKFDDKTLTTICYFDYNQNYFNFVVPDILKDNLPVTHWMELPEPPNQYN